MHQKKNRPLGGGFSFEYIAYLVSLAALATAVKAAG
jgi:hypothetical protein